MTDTKQALNIPAAIIIAGALIAGAVYFGQVGPKQLPAPTQQAEPTPSLEVAPITDEDHIRGNKNASITILEYSDLECPFCKVFHESMIQLLADNPDKIRWVYRHAPIPQLHSQAQAEANAAECAAVQGKFWEFTDVVFAATPSNDGLNLADLPKYAQEAGVADIQKFEACVASNEFADKIEAQLQDGVQAGLRGTPFNMVISSDGKKGQLGGGVPYAQLKAVIEPLL